MVSLASDGTEAGEDDEEPVDTEQHSGPCAMMSEKKPFEGNAEITPQGDKGWKDRVDLRQLCEDEMAVVLRMLEPHKYISDENIGTVTATKHRIHLTPGVRPVHAQSYRAGDRARAA